MVNFIQNLCYPTNFVYNATTRDCFFSEYSLVFQKSRYFTGINHSFLSDKTPSKYPIYRLEILFAFMFNAYRTHFLVS